MRTPAGVSRFVRFSVKTSLMACVLPIAVFPAEITRTFREAAPALLPRHDPAIREKYLADQAANAAAPKPAAPPSRPAAAPVSSDDRLVLDTFIVHPDSASLKPPPPLPRTGAFAPLHDIQGEPFESGSARNARLVKKHMGAFGQALSRVPFFGKAIIGAAIEDEAALQHAQQLNRIADGIELAVLAGQDPEITRKARDAYLKLYYAGPNK